jgi:hypothetical protein
MVYLLMYFYGMRFYYFKEIKHFLSVFIYSLISLNISRHFFRLFKV